MQKIVIIGFGAIGKSVNSLVTRFAAGKLLAVVTLPEFSDLARKEVSVPVLQSVEEAKELGPTLFVECAGHAALHVHGISALRARTDLLIASVGALADRSLETSLRSAAEETGAQVLLPSGALGGLDALGAARYAGIDEVRYTSVKGIAAWQGTHAEKLIDLAKVKERQAFFEGNAREAAQLFPQNANVAAAVALAGAGFERTRVVLTVDPAAKGNRHRIEARGPFGFIDVTVEGKTLPENPKTSMLAPMSLVRAIESRSTALRIL